MCIVTNSSENPAKRGPTLEKPTPPTGYVYFIETANRTHLKIGFSMRPQQRLHDIQGGNPRPCRLLFWIEGTRQTERDLHRKFRAERSAPGASREWFRITSEIREFLDTLELSVPENQIPMRDVKFSNRTSKTATKRGTRKKIVPYLTIPEKDRLFGVITDVRDRAIFRMLYHHGLRASEIGKLNLSHYRPGSRLEMDRLYIKRLKGSMSGEAALVPAAATALRAWVRKRGHTEGPLFPSRERLPICRQRIYQLMRQYCKAADIPEEKSHPHCLKHTCCTHLISDQRESIMDVKTHVGHVAIASTMQYANLTDEANEARAKRLREWR